MTIGAGQQISERSGGEVLQGRLMKKVESTSLLYTTDLAITAALSKEPDELKNYVIIIHFFYNRNMFLTFYIFYILPRCGLDLL